jgi:hypothetical protein
MKHIVTSRDGIKLVTESDERTVPFDCALAATLTAAELVAQGDFQIVESLDLLIPGEEYYFTAPRIAGPEERRAAFRLIQGGRK